MKMCKKERRVLRQMFMGCVSRLGFNREGGVYVRNRHRFLQIINLQPSSYSKNLNYIRIYLWYDKYNKGRYNFKTQGYDVMLLTGDGLDDGRNVGLVTDGSDIPCEEWECQISCVVDFVVKVLDRFSSIDEILKNNEYDSSKKEVDIFHSFYEKLT